MKFHIICILQYVPGIYFIIIIFLNIFVFFSLVLFVDSFLPFVIITPPLFFRTRKIPVSSTYSSSGTSKRSTFSSIPTDNNHRHTGTVTFVGRTAEESQGG